MALNCNNFNLNFIFGIVCLFVCVCAFSLHRESPDMILGDKPLVSEVVLSQVRSLSVTAIASFTFYKCNEWFMKRLVDAQMVQRHHSNYVVAVNIYLDTKWYEARAQGMHATFFDIKARKYEVLEGVGTTSSNEHRGAKWFVVTLS
jgi:hypothetical protein